METIDRLDRYRESLGRSMDRMIKLYRLKNEQYKKRVEAFKPSNIILGYRQKLKVFDTVLRNRMEFWCQKFSHTYILDVPPVSARSIADSLVG